MTVQDAVTDEQNYAREWEDWHRAAEARLSDRHGFLAITNLHWLSEEPQRFDDAPGEWSTGPGGVTVVLAEGEQLVLRESTHPAGDITVTGEHSFGIVPERASILASWPERDAVIEVAKRGGYDIVRPRHPENPLRAAFTHTPAYAPDPHFAVPGRYVRFDEPRPTTVGAAVDGLQHVYDAPGRVEFTLAGRELALTAFPGHTPGSLTILFTDETSGVTTYAANRVLSLAAPGDDGAVLLDFNRATNLPCAYTDLATCPLPPAENRLPVAVEAGEKIPYERGGR